MNNLTANAAKTQDSIDELKENYNSISEKLDVLTAAIAANKPPHSILQLTRSNDNELLRFIKTHPSWIDQSILSNLSVGKLYLKNLICLLFFKDRPKKKGNMQSGSLLLDIQMGKFIATEESPTVFNKDFPDFNTTLYILSIYRAIRTLYDVENTSISIVIFLYIKRLTYWVLINRFYWPHVRAYIISHFHAH